MRTGFILTFIILFVLTACRPEPQRVSPLDIDPTVSARQTQAALPTMIPTNVPEIEATPTATRPVLPTPSPTPALLYPDFIASTVYPAEWSNTAFIDADGNNHTFEEFRGKGIVIQLMSADCVPCPEQTETMRQIAEQRASFQDTENLVFITLSVVGSDSREMLAEYTAQYGLSDPAVTWIAALGSPDLLRALNDYFGEDVVNPHGTTVIVVDQLGLGHRLNQEGTIGAGLLGEAAVFVATDPSLYTE